MRQHGRFSLWLPVGMIGGDLLYFLSATEPPVWPGLAALAIAGLMTWFCRHFLILRAAGAMGMAVAIGWLSGQYAVARALPVQPVPSRAAVVSGPVSSVEHLPDARRVTILHPRLDGGAASPRAVRIRLRRDDMTEIAPGDGLTVRSLLRPPPWPAYPGARDAQKDAFFSGMGAFGFALSKAAVTHAPDTAVSAMVETLRDTIARHARQALPGERGAIAAALLTGETAGIPEEARAAFRDTGLAHLLAIAGLHIAIVMGAVFAVTRWVLTRSEWLALFWPCKQIAACCAFAAGLGYAVLTGLHVPILRSAVMAGLACLALLLGRRAFSLRGLAVAAALIVCLLPDQVAEVSFQMSFAAVMVLGAGYEALRPVLARAASRRVTYHIVTLALTSLLASAASAPYGLYHFGQVQLYTVLTNMIAVPLMAFWVMPAGLLAAMLIPPGLEQWPFAVMGIGIDGILGVARLIASLPGAVLAAAPMPGWGLLLLTSGLIWLCLWRGWLRLWGVPALALGIASCWMAMPADMLISADARLIAVRAAGEVFAYDEGGSRITAEAWRAYWASQAFQPVSVAGRIAPAFAACGEAGCLFSIAANAPAVFIKTGEGPLPCSAASLIAALDGGGGYCPDIPAINRFTAWREGALAVWLRPQGISVLTDRAWRGTRPWVPASPDISPEQAEAPLAPADLPGSGDQ